MHSMRTSRQEALWALRAQCGDREALELLLASVQTPLRSYLRSLVGPTDADDVVQEVLILAYRKLGWLEVPDAFRPWVFRIASRAAFRHLKKTQRWREHVDEDDLREELPAQETPPSPELLQRLATTNGISPASRAVLVLHFQEEMSLPEVAAVLAIPLGTVKSRLAYGLAALRKQLGEARSSPV
jgi:RNA polymerase sigma-70 factor, ECF subfamily